MKGIKHTALVGLLLLAGACKDTTAADNNQVLPGGMANLPGHESVAQDNTHKESPRLITAESYLRSYLRLFGGVTALQAQKDLAAGGAGVFDAWGNYLAALGLPNYALDLPRGEQSNALMVATFERLGIALCDKALEKDWKTAGGVPVASRLIYAFDAAKDPTDKAAFAERFDVLHRTFLGYPARLAPTDRVDSYFTLFDKIRTTHDPKTSRFAATEAAWAAMCYGLIRHPEFQLY